MGHQKRQVEIGNFRFRHLTAIFTKQEHVYCSVFICTEKQTFLSRTIKILHIQFVVFTHNNITLLHIFITHFLIFFFYY